MDNINMTDIKSEYLSDPSADRLRILSESVSQKEKFRVASNKLLNQCFLVKRKEDTKKEYNFVKQNYDLFVTYFDLLGYDIKINEDQGVIGLVNRYGTGRYELSKYGSIFLLILRLLYIERRKQLTTSSEEVVVLMEEIREKYAMLKIRTKPVMDKTMERNIVRELRHFNIVQNLDTDVTNDEARIIIYPSVILAMTVEDVDKFYSMTEDKLKEYAGNSDGISEEDTDKDQTD